MSPRVLRKGIPALIALTLMSTSWPDPARAAGFYAAGFRGGPYRPGYGVVAVGLGYRQRMCGRRSASLCSGARPEGRIDGPRGVVWLSQHRECQCSALVEGTGQLGHGRTRRSGSLGAHVVQACTLPNQILEPTHILSVWRATGLRVILRPVARLAESSWRGSGKCCAPLAMLCRCTCCLR